MNMKIENRLAKTRATGKKCTFLNPPGKSFSLIIRNIGPQGGPTYSPQKLSFL